MCVCVQIVHFSCHKVNLFFCSNFCFCYSKDEMKKKNKHAHVFSLVEMCIWVKIWCVCCAKSAAFESQSLENVTNVLELNFSERIFPDVIDFENESCVCVFFCI